VSIWKKIWLKFGKMQWFTIKKIHMFI
jgi:hypothetical protein